MGDEITEKDELAMNEENADVVEFKPFQFSTEMHLIEATGLTASNTKELLEHLKTVNGSVIYCHTFRTMLIHHFITTGFRNDFAKWIIDDIGDDELGERLTSIDLFEHTTIRSYRNRMVEVIESHLQKDLSRGTYRARKSQEFFFCSARSFVASTGRVAENLEEFANHMRRCSNNSLFFHFIEARLRVGECLNDFSFWLKRSLGMDDLAARINALDPYSCSLEELKDKIVKLVESEL